MSKKQMMQRRYFLITILLAILVLTSGCKNTENQIEEHKNIAVDDVQTIGKDEKKEVAQIDEEIGSILLEDIIESCLDDYSYNKIKKEEWTIYECEANEESMYDGEAIIKIRQEPTIECFDYKDIKQYMREQFDYNKLCHCKYEENKYGITEIYYSWNENDDKWNLVFCGSTAYTVSVEGEFYLHTKLFSYRWDEPIVEEYSEKKIKNANGETSIVTTEIVHTEKKAVYGFDFEDQQEKGYSVEVTIEDINYRLVLIDEQKETQSINWEMGGYDEYPQFLDVNTDGFLDLLLPTLEGELYLFDNEKRRFHKVEYSGYWGIIEVKENQIWNWRKKGGEGYILEVLQLDGNKVVVISREEVIPE